MSQLRNSLRAFAAGGAARLRRLQATVFPAETRASIDKFAFRPDTITVPVGTTVVWTNDDDDLHTVVSLDGRFRSHALDTEDKFSFTFGKAGTFEYFCSLHPHMMGKVVVAPWRADSLR